MVDGQAFLADPQTRFHLLHPLGRGSYGSVYKGRDLETGHVVAVKVIPLSFQDEMDSIQQEIQMLRDCKHPNVVKYYVRLDVRTNAGQYRLKVMPHSVDTNMTQLVMMIDLAGKLCHPRFPLDCDGVLRGRVSQRLDARLWRWVGRRHC